MGENTKIEWATHTFNPWIGCTKVSAECANCYAETQDKHRKWTPEGWGKGRPRKLTSEANWRKPLAWNRAAREAGERARVFCASLADVFDSEVEQGWRISLWRLIEETPCLDWLLLTKRPENIREMLPHTWLQHPRRNVWLGTSVGVPETMWRIDALRTVPAAVRFLSCEPLLADITPVDLTGIHWVIAGGESGPGARPMHPDWARKLRDECVEQEAAFLFKQWGEWRPEYADGAACGWNCHLWPDGSMSYRVGKKVAGRLLDGFEWNQLPA